MRQLISIFMILILSGCAAGTMMGAGQGGRTTDHRSYAEAHTDNRVAAAVNRALVNSPEIQATDIKVAVHEAVVTLRGKVSSTAYAVKVEDVVRNVKGVKAVINKLHVE